MSVETFSSPALAVKQSDWKPGLTGKQFFVMAYVPDKKSVWVSESIFERGKEGTVYQFHKDSTTPEITITLPFPAYIISAPGRKNTETPPDPRTLLVVKDKLWITDFIHGGLYSADKTKSGTATIEYQPMDPGPTEFGEQLWGLAYGGNYLWVTDGGSKPRLHCFDPSAPGTPHATLALGKSLGDVLLRDVVYKDNSVWIVYQGGGINNAGLCQCDANPATPVFKKKWDIPGALSLQVQGNTLYVGCKDGMIWSLDLAAQDSSPSRLVSSKALGNKILSDYFAVDAAHNIWVLDTEKSGHLYQLGKSGELVGDFELNSAGEGVDPAQIIWTADDDDLLLIADFAKNGRVMAVTPTGKINPAGEAQYFLKAVKDSGNAEPGALFEPFKIEAFDKTNPSTRVSAAADLTIKGSDDNVTAKFATLSKGVEHVEIPAIGNSPVINDLTAGKHDGNINVIANGRGYSGTLFTGTIGAQITKITIAPETRRYALQGMEFKEVDARVEVLPVEAKNKAVELKITGEAIFVGTNGATLQVKSGAPWESVRAGRKAGPVKLKASDGGVSSNEITWYINPVPNKIVPPDYGNIPHRGIDEYMLKRRFRITGEQDLDSPGTTMPVCHWPLMLWLESDVIETVKFTGANISHGGRQAYILTDDEDTSKGYAALGADTKISVPDNHTDPITIHYGTPDDRIDGDPMLVGHIIITFSA